MTGEDHQHGHEDELTAVLRQVAEGELGVDEAAALLASSPEEGGFGDPLEAAPFTGFSDLVGPPADFRSPVPPTPPRPPVPPRLALRGRSSGRTDLLLALARMGVTRDWLEALRTTSLADSDPEVVVGLAACGATPDWLRAAGEVELDGATIVALAERGVTPDWLRAASEAADVADGEALIGLAEAGVNADLLPELLQLARR